MVQHLTATSQLLVGYNETELICKKYLSDPCTKFEVSSVSRCRDFTWGVKF